MFRRVISLIVALLVISDAFGQKPVNDKPAFIRFIGPQTMMFAHYRASELFKIPAVQSLVASMPGGKEQMEKDFQKDLGLLLVDVDTVTLYLDQFEFVDGQPRPPRPLYILLTAKKNLDYEVLRRPLGQYLQTSQLGKYELTVGVRQALIRLDNRSALFLPDTGGRDVEALKKEPLLQFARLDGGADIPDHWKQSIAIARDQKTLFFTGFRMQPELGKLAEEALKNAPPLAAPFKALTKVESAYIAMTYVPNQAEDCQFTIGTRFPDAKSAQAGLGAIKFGIASSKMAINSLPKKEVPRNVENFWAYSAGYARKQLDLIKPEQKENEVIIAYPMNSQEFLPVLTLAIEKVRFAADKMLSASNMRKLMIAMHNYHNDYNHLPEAMTLKEGKPLHSWRVQILPYIEEDKIYRQLRLDEPWDSELNKKVFESNPMPKLFEHPKMKDGVNKLTYYQVFYSTSAAKSPAGLRLGVKLTLGQLTVKDGTSNTIVMIENGKPVLWYKPEDVEFDGADAFPKLTTPWGNNRAQVAFFDASIRTLSLGKEVDMWKALVTWVGGEKIDLSKLEE